MSCGVGLRHSLDPALLWLWRRLGPTSLGTSICHGCSPRKRPKKKKKIGKVCKYLKNLRDPVPLNFPESPSLAHTESAPMSDEAIIALHEDAPEGVTLQKEANYPYAPLPSLLVISKPSTRIRYQHAQGPIIKYNPGLMNQHILDKAHTRTHTKIC